MVSIFLEKYFLKPDAELITALIVATLSIQTYENLKKMNIFKNEKLCVIYDPVIVLSEYKRQNNKTDLGSKKFIISAGRLTKQKNQELLIKFFEKISKKYDHLELLICGHGEKEQYLKNLVKKMKLNNKIKFLGHVENIKNFLVLTCEQKVYLIYLKHPQCM